MITKKMPKNIDKVLNLTINRWCILFRRFYMTYIFLNNKQSKHVFYLGVGEMLGLLSLSSNQNPTEYFNLTKLQIFVRNKHE